MILDEILANTRAELAHRKTETSQAELEKRLGKLSGPRDFSRSLEAGDCVSVIAEVKKASPSAGVIRKDFDPARLGACYREGGASAISVLTDEKYFEGRLEYLRVVSEASGLPVLRKDFIVDPWQVYEARVAGADAILLIVAALEPVELASLLALARELGMAALVETHDRDELRIARDAGARVIGINNRNLGTFDVDLATTERLAGLAPEGCVLVSESGIHSREDVERVAAAGADAVLVGTSIVGSGDPIEKLAELAGVKRGKGA
jgi:indole-3-glycerol phosphate synthase